MSDEDIDDTTQRLQQTVDKVKTLSLVANAHNLTPPPRIEQTGDSQVAIIKNLEATPRLQEIYLEVQGLAVDPKTRQLVKISEQIMNRDGAKKLVAELKKIALEAEFGNFREDDLPEYHEAFFEQAWKHFIAYHDFYELESRNYDYIWITLGMFILAAFSKGKSGKYINLLGRTYSEDMLGKLFKEGDKNQKKPEGFLDKMNPFKKII